MPPFTEWTCPKCRRRFDDSYERDVIKCPYCDHIMNVSETRQRIKEAQKEVERYAEEMKRQDEEARKASEGNNG